MVKSSYLSFLLLCFVFGAADAQVSNTQVYFSCPGQITVTYDLDSDRPVDVTLYYSRNKCDWLIAKTVSGDIAAQTTGTDKTIIWDCYADSIRFGKFYFKVDFPECVMINGVCWATSNVDMPGTFAEKPEDAGMFYQWGSNVGWSSTDPLTASDGINTWRDLSETVWLPEKNPCPAGWRVPTDIELGSLTNTTYVTSGWTTENGIDGYCFTDIATGNSIFLPAAGHRWGSNGTLGADGNYWSSNYPYFLYFSSSMMVLGSSTSKKDGNCIRCVSED